MKAHVLTKINGKKSNKNKSSVKVLLDDAIAG